MEATPYAGPDNRRISVLARDLLDRVGDRWSALVLYALDAGPLRFSDLKVRVDEFGPNRLRRTAISHKMLAESLRGLRRDGLVERCRLSLDDRRGGYGLTHLGRSFREPMMAVHRWTEAHAREIEAARGQFDLELKSK